MQRAEQKVENRWQNSTKMPLASKTANKCGIEDCPKVAVKDGMCQEHDELESMIDTTNKEPYESVLEESADLIGEPAMDRGEDSLQTNLTNNQSLLDGTQTRGSRRQQGSAEIIDLFAHDPTTETQREKARQARQKEETEGGLSNG